MSGLARNRWQPQRGRAGSRHGPESAELPCDSLAGRRRSGEEGEAGERREKRGWGGYGLSLSGTCGPALR